MSSRLKAILTSDLSGDTLLVEVIIYPFAGATQKQNRAVSTVKRDLMKDAGRWFHRKNRRFPPLRMDRIM